MKKYLIFLSILLISKGLVAQEAKTVSLNVYGGYTFTDQVNFELSYAKAEAAFQYGAGLEYFVQSNSSIEVKYLRMDTHLPYYLANGTHVNIDKDKGAVQYILAEFSEYIGNSTSKAMPYAGAGLGAGIISIKDGNSTTKFAWDAKVGVKIRTASSVSINLQAYLQSIISAVGNDYWLYPGYPGGVVAVSDYVTLLQFGLGAVVSFNFAKHK